MCIAVPAKPTESPTASSTGPNEITVTWTYDNQPDCNVTAFRIVYNPSDKPDQVYEKSVHGSDALKKSMVLKDHIENCRNYDIKLAAVNSVGSSPTSDAQIVYVSAGMFVLR